MAGDYRAPWTIYGANNVDLTLPSAVQPLIAAPSAKCTIYVQRVSFIPALFTGTVLQFIDSLTRVVVGTISIPTAAAYALNNGVWNYAPLDFGPSGTPLSKGAHLLLGGSANGQLHIDAYIKPQKLSR